VRQTGLWAYTISMKPKPQSDEYKAFEGLLGRVLSVSKVELNKRIEEDKREKRTPKTPFRAADVESR
jgi:hypothetical protein